MKKSSRRTSTRGSCATNQKSTSASTARKKSRTSTATKSRASSATNPKSVSAKRNSRKTTSQSQKPSRTTTSETSRGIRLQKVLANAGFASRRACEELITAGRVEVDRRVVTELGTRVDPTKQEIRVDTQTIKKRIKSVTILLNKPRGILCTASDPRGRTRVIDIVPAKLGRLFSVGRLDRESEGLIVLTNDGDLAQTLAHPRFGVIKVYRVLVAGEVLAADVAQMRKGVRLAGQLVRAEHVIIKGRRKQSTILEITLKEGINREIRRMLAKLDHKVMQLQRIAIGTLKLGKMLPGEYRELTRDEIKTLKSVPQRVENSISLLRGTESPRRN